LLKKIFTPRRNRPRGQGSTGNNNDTFLTPACYNFNKQQAHEATINNYTAILQQLALLSNSCYVIQVYL